MATKKPADLTTRVLVEIRDELKSHGRKLDEHGAQLTDIRAELRGHGATLNQVLRAVEHGNAQRDERVLDHEARISRIEQRIGIQS